MDVAEDTPPPPPPAFSPSSARDVSQTPGSARGSLGGESLASSATGVQEILRSVVAMGGSEPRTLRQEIQLLQAEVASLTARLESTTRRNVELEAAEQRLHEYEEEMALHLDHADEQHQKNEALTENLETQNRRSLKLWKAQQEAESARATAEGELQEKLVHLRDLRTQSTEVEEAHGSLKVQHGAAMAALRTYEQGPDPHLLSELVEELQATVIQQQEDLAMARVVELALTRELQEHKRQHDADMQGCDLAVEAATKALEAAREAQRDAEQRLAPAEAAVTAGLERERAASRTLAAIEVDLQSGSGGADPAVVLALKRENAELRRRLGDQPEPEPEVSVDWKTAKKASAGWKKVQVMTKALPKGQSGMPLYQTKRLIGKVLEDKVIGDAKVGTVSERTPFATFFRDWVHKQYGLKETADQKILAIIKTVRTHGATRLYHKANSKTADSKYDPRLWAFGQLTGITDSYAQSLVEKGADDGSDALAMSLDARRGLADYIIDLLALLYEGNHGGINEDMGDGKRGEDGWLPAAHVRKALQVHFETVAPPSELPGASGFTSKQGWVSPYGNTTLHVRGIPKDCEGEEELAAIFRPFGRYVQGTVRQRSATVVDGVEVVALSWALVTFLDEASMENALAAQAKSPITAGADQTELSCQKVDAEKAASSTGSFGKTWRKGSAKAASEVDRLLALEALVRTRIQLMSRPTLLVYCCVSVPD